MNGQHSEELLRHLEKQNEILMEAYRSLSYELHRLQVEEEMLTRKLHEIISPEAIAKKDNHVQSTDKNEEVACPEASMSNNSNGP